MDAGRSRLPNRSGARGNRPNSADRQRKRISGAHAADWRPALRGYVDCIEREAVSLLPFTNEGAETVATVAETKCDGARQRIATTTEALFGATQHSRELAAQFVADERKKLLASIVTLRAAAQAGRQPGAATTPQTFPAAPQGRAF